MADKGFTASLGPIKIEPTKTAEQAAFDTWWAARCREGDPLRNQRTAGVRAAFAAGYAARQSNIHEDRPVFMPSMWTDL